MTQCPCHFVQETPYKGAQQTTRVINTHLTALVSYHTQTVNSKMAKVITFCLLLSKYCSNTLCDLLFKMADPKWRIQNGGSKMADQETDFYKKAKPNLLFTIFKIRNHNGICIQCPESKESYLD